MMYPDACGMRTQDFRTQRPLMVGFVGLSQFSSLSQVPYVPVQLPVSKYEDTWP